MSMNRGSATVYNVGLCNISARCWLEARLVSTDINMREAPEAGSDAGNRWAEQDTGRYTRLTTSIKCAACPYQRHEYNAFRPTDGRTPRSANGEQ